MFFFPLIYFSPTCLLGLTRFSLAFFLLLPLNFYQFESSGYDRTLESAAALAFGLYPVGQEDEDVRDNSLFYNHEIVVPVHSSQPENDRESPPPHPIRYSEILFGDIN